MPGSQNCSLNSHRKPRRNVLRVFDVCLEIQCDSKSYFGFVVDRFSELRHVLAILAYSLKQTKCPAVKELEEFQRIILLQIQNNFYNRFALLNKHQIFSIRFNEAFCGNSVNNFDCRAFSLFETVAGNRMKTIAILWYAQAWRIRPPQIHNNFQNCLAIPNKHRIFSLGSKEAFCSNSLNISNCRCKCKFSQCQAYADFIVFTSFSYFIILHTKIIFGVALHF